MDDLVPNTCKHVIETNSLRPNGELCFDEHPVRVSSRNEELLVHLDNNSNPVFELEMFVVEFTHILTHFTRTCLQLNL